MKFKVKVNYIKNRSKDWRKLSEVKDNSYRNRDRGYINCRLIIVEISYRSIIELEIIRDKS